MKKSILFIAIAATGCAGKIDRATIYTEEGLRLADAEWDRAYAARLDDCKERHEAESPGAEDCFGSWYDADGHVEAVLRSAVGLLRAYWTARAAGQRPDWQVVAGRLTDILDDLPAEAREYFDRVRGL